MIIDLVTSLNEVPLAGLMLVVAIGFFVGRLKWRGLTIGPGGATLFTALALSWLGLDLTEMYGTSERPLTVGHLGFALFIYSVGFEAGPRFFSTVLRGQGLRFVVVGLAVVAGAVLAAIVCSRAFGFGATITAGSLSGALTSFPTYAAAAATLGDPKLILVFAVTYPVGLALVILCVQLIPRWMNTDLADDTEPAEEMPRFHHSPDAWRVFRVTKEEVVGHTLGELDLTHRTGCYVVRVHRETKVFRAEAQTTLTEGDRLLVQGRPDHLHEFEAFVGPEVSDDQLGTPVSRSVVVLHSGAEGKTLAELALTTRHRVLVTGIDRGDVHIVPSADVVVMHADVLMLTGSRRGIRSAAAELGRFEKSVHETDIAIYAGGIVLGLLLTRLRVGGTPVIGTAAGLLLAGILLGRFRRIGRISANVPRAARQLVRDLGILLFIAEMGIWAGDQPLDAMRGGFLPAAVSAAFITVAPILLALFVGRKLLGLRPVDAWGAICGGMTSSAALVALKAAADSNEPAVSYAAAYGVASVVVTLAGPVVVALV